MPKADERKPNPLGLVRYFSELQDRRVKKRCRHPLMTVLVMALAAVVAGCNGWEEIEDFCDDRRDWFERFLEMPHGVPDATTFARVFRLLRPESFFRCVSAWVQSLAAPLEGQVVAFDGKSFRGALKRAPLGAALHSVHLWVCEQRLLLGQTMVAGAPEEGAAVRSLLELLELRGALLTGDALHCNRETAQAIVKAEADWLLHLKANDAPTHGAVQQFFEAALEQKFEGLSVRHEHHVEQGHGRTEVREAWSFPAKVCALPGAPWPKLQSLTVLDRTRMNGDAVTRERHYYLSSLAPSARRISAAARQHWEVENGLHWVLDVQMGEDRCAVHDANAAANLGALRRLALMLAQREHSFTRKTRPRSVRSKLAKAQRNTAYLEKLLTAGITGD
jgi:predicted transposase YbfD/YdcC